MRKSFLTMAMVIALALGMMAPAIADNHSEITSPTAGEVVYENALNLRVTDDSDNPVAWAVRPHTEACDNYADTLAGNVNVDEPDDYVWDGSEFSAELDISDWDAGRYCFAFNTRDTGDDDGSRLMQDFYIVDEYAKVGGNIDHADYLIDHHSDVELKELRGRQLSHAFSGVVGNIGDETVGSITVNYRQLDEHQTFEGAELSLSAAGGIGVDDPTARGAVVAVDGAEIILLDKDASGDFPRGAAIVRPHGVPSLSKYEIDNTPGSTGVDSWIGLENGNVEVGIR